MTFWGAEVTAEKPFPYVPLPEAGQLRITQATLGLNASQGERAVLSCKVGKEETLICSLREGLNESTNLDIVLDQYAELTVQSAKKGGKASIHIVGYHILDEDPNEGDEDDEGVMLDEDEDVDGAEELMNSLPAETLKKLLQLRAARMGSDSDSEGSEDDEEMEEDSDEYDSEDLAIERKPSVIIEEITEEEEPEAAAQGSAATQQTTSATVVKTDKKGKPVGAAQVTQTTTTVPPAQPADEDDSSDEEDDDAALDEADESDEEPEEDPKLGKRKAANAKLEAKSGKAEKAAKKEAVKVAQTPAAKKSKTEAVVTPAVPASADKPLKGIKKFDNGFIVENVSMGDPAGKLAKGGKKVVVKYVGKLAKTGKIFDQTKGNKTFSFRLGVGEVIKGWDQGVVGMRVGDKRKLTVPPQMAYGPKGIPNAIPGNSTLLFDVELVDVKG